jgi:hypothetical protein
MINVYVSSLTIMCRNDENVNSPSPFNKHDKYSISNLITESVLCRDKINRK